MKEKREGVESILAKAEKFFARGNFPLAKVEFEKAARLLNRPNIPHIMDKLAVCNREIDGQRAKELTKKAKRCLDKNNIDEALHCYEQALAFSNDVRLAERIERLRADRCGRDTQKGAQETEAAGNYGLAAQLYGQAFEARNDPDFLVGKARCQVKAGNFQEAIPIYESLDRVEPALRRSYQYDYGFALVRQGRYYEGLKVWEGLQSPDDRFRVQQASVRALLVADLFARWRRAEDFAAIYEQGRYLLTGQDRQDKQADLETVVEHCRYAQLDSLWREKRYETIADFIAPFPAALESPLLSLCAKTYFKLVEESGRNVSKLGLFWLTALFDRQISAPFADNDEDRSKVRHDLIRRAEKMISGLAEAGDETAKKELTGWAIDRRLIEELDHLVKGREHLSHLVCTPRFARRFGRAVEVLALLRDSRDSFASNELYLETGSYFTEAGNSLYLLAAGDYDRAMAQIPDKGQVNDDLLRYGLLKVSFACGLHHIEKKASKPWRFFEEASALFTMAPAYEEELARKAMLAHDPQVLEGFEAVLGQIYRVWPSKKTGEALSMVMTEHALALPFGKGPNQKAFENIMHKALAINPDNELARLTLGDVRAGIEIMEMSKAMGRNKMAKAMRIAQDSASDEVREKYFEFLGDLADELEKAAISRKQKVFYMKELRDWCAKMAPTHPFINRVNIWLTGMDDQE